VLRETLALAHPVIPFVTEELWELMGEADLLAGARMPGVDDALRDPAAEDAVVRAIDAIRAVRAWRESLDVRPGAEVRAVLRADGYDETAGLVARMARLVWTDDEPAATIAVPGGVVGVPAGAGVDLDAAERKREAERARLRAEIERAERTLANAGFVAKAPDHVVAAERAKLERLRADLDAL